MLAARKEVFVDLLESNLPVLGGLYELTRSMKSARYLILGDLSTLWCFLR